eukprot:m.47409 g.47409  ORF g.47409 m.47409 type:complete len:63 (+) comp10977_c2_seq1:189-377(+)
MCFCLPARHSAIWVCTEDGLFAHMHIVRTLAKRALALARSFDLAHLAPKRSPSNKATTQSIR